MKSALAAAPLFCFAVSAPALAQSEPVTADEPQTVTVETRDAEDEAVAETMATDETAQGSATDILSGNTITILLDGRAAVSNGERSWANRGFGKASFQGTEDRNYRLSVVPMEAAIIWTPRFTNSLSASVSAAWQRHQEHAVDLLEAFVSFLPPQKGPVGFSARAGVMWPEISLEHTTGGAWSTVNTLTPSAINAWVGEEVKVLGAEATVRASLGQHDLALTGAIFGFDDTSGTLLSFRGWALHNEKATVFGHFPLPPRNPFMEGAQEGQTKSMIELDNRPGFYGRLEWRPPWPVGAALFYYDNRGDPEEFNRDLQWGWRTRFWNLGINADLGPNTRLLAQGMTGSTIMGFEEDGVAWVHTRFRSGYVSLTQSLSDRAAVTGRIETFRTRERGSEMSPDESEHGWSTTVALRYNFNERFTGFAEAFNVRSRRGVRTRVGLDPFQAQTVFQLGLRIQL